MTRRLILNAVVRGQLGGHTAAWRRSSADLSDVTTLDYWADLAATLERGRFDTLFLADSLALPADPGMPLQWPIDPFVLISALAGRTRHIGLVATHSTTFNFAYTTARQLASIDHLSAGRAGWNVVTSIDDSAALNYGSDRLTEHDLRYEIADDYVDAVKKLWLAWSPSAVVADEKSGVLLDTAGVRAVNHESVHLRVRGPLTTPRSPQGVPLIAQAGGSDQGIDLAGKHADIVYARQLDIDSARVYYDRVKAAAVRHGRDPESVKILPGLVPVIGTSRQDALAQIDALRSADNLERRLPDLAVSLGIDVSARDLDRDFPFDAVDPESAAPTAAAAVAVARAQGARSLRDVVHALYGAAAESSGHRVSAGTPQQIADDIEHWFESGVLDGISVHANVLPDDIEAFVDRVVPLLRDRGLVQEEYSSGTLRDKLALPLPDVDDSRFTPYWPNHATVGAAS